MSVIRSETRLTKENVWFHLLNFSKRKWLGSDYFHLNLVEQVDLSSPEKREELAKTQRELAKIIGQLTNDLITLKDQRRIISSGLGYKIAETPEELEQAWKYLYSKIDEVIKRINWLKEGYQLMVHTKENETIDAFASMEEEIKA